MRRLSMGMVVLVLATIFLSSGCVDKGPKVVVPLAGESGKAAEQLVMLNQLVFSSSEEYSDCSNR